MLTMEQPHSFKLILHSKRANLYYLEHCRVMQKDGRVVYLTETKKANLYWNIPIANTTFILLGTGTSITQAAMRLLAKAGVLVGFTGGAGTPLIAGVEIEWLTPQNEYRPTKYLQGWLAFWFDEQKRLAAAKDFQHSRLQFIQSTWQKDRDLQAEGFFADDCDFSKVLKEFAQKINSASTIEYLFSCEGRMTKQLYGIAASRVKIEDFTRDSAKGDLPNDFLNHGNYLAYGLAATALWVIGIPHGFAVMHGKTRRGALVFDVADLVKDAIILPWAFICARDKVKEQEFRQQIIQKFDEHQALDYMFNKVKEISLAQCNIESKETPVDDCYLYFSV